MQHVNILWLMCNNATIKSDKVDLKWILSFQVLDLICVTSVSLLLSSRWQIIILYKPGGTHKSILCTDYAPPYKLGGISFIVQTCITQFSARSDPMNHLRMPILSIYCILIRAVLLLLMDSYTFKHICGYITLHICVSGHQIILKSLQITNHVRMDNSIICLILSTIATLIHWSGTSIYRLIRSSGTLIYTNSHIISFLALNSLQVGASQASWQL